MTGQDTLIIEMPREEATDLLDFLSGIEGDGEVETCQAYNDFYNLLTDYVDKLPEDGGDEIEV